MAPSSAGRRSSDGVSTLLPRLIHAALTLLGVMALVFVLFHAFGGDPAEILGGLNARPEQIASIREQLGLDRPLWVQFGRYLGQIVSLDFGRSWATQEPVAQILASRLPATLTVMGPILLLEVLLAIPLALAVAVLRGSLTDRLLMGLTTVAMSISFLVYVIVGQWLFAFELGWFPVQGWSTQAWRNLIQYAPLPIGLAVLVGLAPLVRLYRSFFLEEIGRDHVRTARAKGLATSRILLRHVLPNAWIPILAQLGAQLPGVFVGSFLIESFFSIPGLGREILLAVNRSDYPVIQAVTILLALVTLIVNASTDALYRRADPRVGAAA